MVPLTALNLHQSITYEGSLMKKGTKEGSAGTLTVNIMYEPFDDDVIGGVHTIVYNKEMSLAQFDNAFIEAMVMPQKPAAVARRSANHSEENSGNHLTYFAVPPLHPSPPPQACYLKDALINLYTSKLSVFPYMADV
jgi:hypothetical protein